MTIYINKKSQRLAEQRDKHHVDMIQPHTYDKTSKKNVINPEFVKHYPHRVKDYFTPAEIKKAGLPKLVDYGKKVEAYQQAQRNRIEQLKNRMAERRVSGDPREMIQKLRGR